MFRRIHVSAIALVAIGGLLGSIGQSQSDPVGQGCPAGDCHDGGS